MSETKQEKTKKIKKTPSAIVQYNLSGEQTGEIVSPKEIFDIKASPALLSQYIRVFQTNQRQGTASTKTRAEVAGTTKKIYKQKGTGKARHGSQRAPIFKGGGVVGGPKPKTYKLNMNKKQKKLALFTSLTMKLHEGSIVGLVEDTKKITLKTKQIAIFVKKMQFANKKVLFILPTGEVTNFTLAARNIPNVSYSLVRMINAYDILNASKVIFINTSLDELITHFVQNG